MQHKTATPERDGGHNVCSKAETNKTANLDRDYEKNGKQITSNNNNKTAVSEGVCSINGGWAQGCRSRFQRRAVWLNPKKKHLGVGEKTLSETKHPF